MGQSSLPLASAEAHERAFRRLGWERQRKTTGGNPHIILTKPGQRATLSIPAHKGRDVKRALLQKLLSAAGVTEQEYVAAFENRVKKT